MSMEILNIIASLAIIGVLAWKIFRTVDDFFFVKDVKIVSGVEHKPKKTYTWNGKEYTGRELMSMGLCCFAKNDDGVRLLFMGEEVWLD